MRDHWWWRPGWRPGRRMYTWHVTFCDQPAVRDLAGRARDLLREVPGLDLIPEPWLHLTTQDVGFSDAVSVADLAAITAAARSRLAAVPPAAVTIGPARVLSEGIGCDAHPAAALHPVRDAVRAAIGEVRGPARVPGEAGWWPHVSLAYASADGPADPAEAALAGFTTAAAITVAEIQLILLGRDERLYQWETQATVSLGAADG
jgi:2'-5' RNA ligase superfamily